MPFKAGRLSPSFCLVGSSGANRRGRTGLAAMLKDRADKEI